MKPAPWILLAIVAPGLWAQEPAAPPLHLLPAADASAFETWLKGTGEADPRGVFRMESGVLHISGEDRGYLATRQAFSNYHLSLEYRWGTRTDGGPYVRNSGVLLHGAGAHGAVGGVWMASLEVQLAQGCEGDLIAIRGAKEPKLDFACRTRMAEDRHTRWDAQGSLTPYSGRQFWWSRHQPFFAEWLDTRGRDDLASPLGEWTRVECICLGRRVTVKINGHTVNEAEQVSPAAGRVLLQNEGHEVFFRNWTLQPLKAP